jgi:long-subunit acyl-CoA synthetase (AMP-forming)
MGSVGRVDDVITLVSGEKVIPGPAEGFVLAHAAVQSAVMFGRARNRVGMLVEPTGAHAIDPTDQKALEAFRNTVW